jgi:hypothetical protein
MRIRIAICGFTLSAIVTAFYFSHASRAEEGAHPLKQPNADTAVTDEVLAVIRLGLRAAAAPNLARDQKLERVTTEPFHVLAQGCAGPFSLHEGFWIHVYVTPGGHDMMSTGKGVYPPGTIILKQKLRDAGGRKTELFTGMLKREKGYAPQVGDWEFFVLSSRANRVFLNQELFSCAECHQSFHATDFVSRSYVTESAPPDWTLIPQLPAPK